MTARSAALSDPLEIVPLDAPPDATLVLPGSKSITNRALICAALADGTSVLSGALLSDDTEAMLDCLGALGVRCQVDPGPAHRSSGEDRATPRIVVTGVGGVLGGDGAVLDARLSGTTSRFVAPLAVLSGGHHVLDGGGSLRARPMADLWEALGRLDAEVLPLGEPGHLPVELYGGPHGVSGGEVTVRGDVSSQFLTGLLLAAPAMRQGLKVHIDGPLVSRPYVEMTLAVMRAFGAGVTVVHPEGQRLSIEVRSGAYAAREYAVEPDASTASYFFALAAVTRGRIGVEGLGISSVQGDLGFTRVLSAMGADVDSGDDFTQVRGTGTLSGVAVDMVDISDTAPTLGAIAPLAGGEVEVSGIAFARGKESDRIAAIVTELQRLGIAARERDDGFTVAPGRPVPAVVSTYDDHRIAMSFAVLGLACDGLSIADPGCVDKTFPAFWDVIESLRNGADPEPIP